MAAERGAAAAARSVGGNAEPAVDAVQPGTVGVAAVGAPASGVVPLIVENAKPGAVTSLRIAARAVDADGRTVGRAATRTVVPPVLEPDELGLARVDFRDSTLPLTSRFEFEISSKHAGNARTVTLEPITFRLSPPTIGPVAQTLDVTLRNPTEDRARGPVRVAVMCLGESRRPVRYVAKLVNVTRLAPGASINTRVELDELCPAYVVGGTATSAG
jgi:hypothetical protein